MITIFRPLNTPIGELLLAGETSDRPHTIGLPSGKGRVRPRPDWRLETDAFDRAARQLSEYFDRQRTEFDFEYDLHGTDFQVQVWRALAEIPYGATWSYAELAAHVGRPAASRAVGAANGRNPLPIVLPCHRVIGADGSMTGYGGGLEAKRYLLALEGWRPGDREAAQEALFAPAV